MEENEGGWRPSYETCWHCGKRVRADEVICVWCGATRVPEKRREQIWAPPEPSWEPPYQSGRNSAPHGQPPRQHGPFLAPQDDARAMPSYGAAPMPYGTLPGDFASPADDSPLGVAVPLQQESPQSPHPYQPPAAQHPYQPQPPQWQPQAAPDWRRTPAPTPQYVPSTGPLTWDGDQSERAKKAAGSSSTADSYVEDEDTSEHPKLPRQAPPMQQLGRVRLVQGDHRADRGEQRGNRGSQQVHKDHRARQGGQVDIDQPQAYADGPPDRGVRYAHGHGPGPEQGYGYEPQQGYGYEPQQGYGSGYGPPYQAGYQFEYDARYGSGQPGYGPEYDYGSTYGYPPSMPVEEPGRVQQVVDRVWDMVHAEDALAWLEAKAQRVMPYMQQFLPIAEQLAPEKNLTSRRALNLLSPIGLGCIGGFIGGVIWCCAVAAIHAEIGIFAIPMAYLIGWGVATGSLRRGIMPVVLAIFITIGAWAICIAIIIHLGLVITPLEFLFLLAALVTSVVPIRSMKRERWERRY